MNAFYDGQYDVLLSTSIIESGLDIPSANTIVIHRADMFGLAQLYQMRGRVGRSKTRAYGYLTYNENNGLTDSAEKRLKVMQSLDSLGAGFNLASYDLDLRGAGNLVGEEQSGHIKEVGYELYQAMLEEAVAERQGEAAEESWAPQINVGISVLIPEDYVPDLDLRMGLYRRLSSLTARADIDAFAAEVVDRFGHYLKKCSICWPFSPLKLTASRQVLKKSMPARRALQCFRNQLFANPEKLIAHVSENQARIKIRLIKAWFSAPKLKMPMSVCVFRPSWRSNWPNWPRDYCTANFCRAFSINRLRYSGSCAPISKNLPPAKKAGTPCTPKSRAAASSLRVASISFSLSNNSANNGTSMPCRPAISTTRQCCQYCDLAQNAPRTKPRQSYAAGRCWRPTE